MDFTEYVAARRTSLVRAVVLLAALRPPWLRGYRSWTPCQSACPRERRTAFRI